jgi:thiosulfate dehydrogenase [quinone] large subunit
MEDQKFTRLHMIALVILRVLVGWHFLYEGIAKLSKPSWSAAGYLTQSRGIFSGFFRWMASNPDALATVNQLNMWGLTLIGVGLILGCFTRLASAAGILFILLLYLCNPPFIGYFYSIPMEGSYLIVNKNLVELGALLVLMVTASGRFAGLDRIIHGLLRKKAA